MVKFKIGFFLFLLSMPFCLIAENCTCLKGNRITETYLIIKQNGIDSIKFLIKGSTKLLGQHYKNVYMQSKDLKADSLVGYIRATPDCKRMYFFNLANKEENIVYDITLNFHDTFPIKYVDTQGMEYTLFHSPKVKYSHDSLKTIELEPFLFDSNRYKIAFIENIGFTYPLYLNWIDLSESYYGVKMSLLHKEIDGKSVYVSLGSPYLCKETIITDIDTLYENEIRHYGELVYSNDKNIINSIRSSKDVFFIIKTINWDGTIHLIDQLIDNKFCDYGSALLAFWLNDPSFYMERLGVDSKNEWWSAGLRLHTKLMTRLMEGYYKKSDNYFNPADYYSKFMDNAFYIPLKLRIPSRGTKYVEILK